MVEQEKPTTKQDHRALGRKQLWAIWIAIGTALGSTGIPKVVELLNTRPSVEQVQGMIADQTEALTKAQNAGVDALRNLDRTLQQIRDKLDDHLLASGSAEGRLSLMQDILRNCCTKAAAIEAVVKAVAPPPPKPTPKPKAEKCMSKLPGPGLEKEPECVSPPAPAMLEAPRELDKLEKVPDFKMQRAD